MFLALLFFMHVGCDTCHRRPEWRPTLGGRQRSRPCPRGNCGPLLTSAPLRHGFRRQGHGCVHPGLTGFRRIRCGLRRLSFRTLPRALRHRVALAAAFLGFVASPSPPSRARTFVLSLALFPTPNSSPSESLSIATSSTLRRLHASRPHPNSRGTRPGSPATRASARWAATSAW